MKKILFFLLFLPALANAQFKRSATELAKDNIRDYVTSKLFRNASYLAISYGELNFRKEHDANVAGTITHDFNILEIQNAGNRKDSVQKSYKFLFYLDEKMDVVKAEEYY